MLLVEVGEYPYLKKIGVDFVVIDLNCTHNVILGRLALEDLEGCDIYRALGHEIHNANKSQNNPVGPKSHLRLLSLGL